MAKFAAETLFKARRDLHEARAEIAELRKALEMGEAPYTLEMWEASNSQETRDAFAARALVQEWGSPVRALQRLGFNVLNEAGQWKPKVVALLAEAVLNTPGVRALMDANLANIDEAWDKILERQRRVALFGNDDVSVKAATQLAKLENRYPKDTLPVVPGTTVNLHVLVSGADAAKAVEATTHEHDPLAILSHEPSEEGVAIVTGDKLGAER